MKPRSVYTPSVIGRFNGWQRKPDYFGCAPQKCFQLRFLLVGGATRPHSRYFRNLLPLVSVVGLFSPLFFLLCLSQISLSCGLPRFLKTSCFVVSDLFGKLSCFILTMCPAHLIRLLTILPTIQAIVPTYSLRSFILLLSTLFTLAILLIQLFSHTCSLCWCSSERANVSTP